MCSEIMVILRRARILSIRWLCILGICLSVDECPRPVIGMSMVGMVLKVMSILILGAGVKVLLGFPVLRSVLTRLTWASMPYR